MNTEKKNAFVFEDVKVNVKIKLAALWTALMFLYIFKDYFNLYQPGAMTSIMNGQVWKFQVDQMFLLSSMILMTIPSIMIALSLILKAKANRWLNLSLGIFYLLVVLGSAIGESWAYYLFSSFVESLLLVMIIIYALKWPKQETDIP